MRKHRTRRFIALALLICIVSAILPAQAATGQSVTVLFTQDWHDQFSAHADPNGGSYLGAAYLSARIKQERNAQQELLLLDAGGFSMGSLLESIYTTHAPELDLLGRMGYDAVTLGTDAFAYGTQGLAQMLGAAQQHATLPALLLSNVTTQDEALNMELDSYGAQEYRIFEKNGVRIAVFALLDNELGSDIEGISIEKPAEAAARIVAQLQQSEQYDLLICLSYGGVDKNGDMTELALAQTLPELDVIVCGANEGLEAPVQEGSTLLVSAGAYGENLGKLVLRQNGDSWAVSSYELISIHSSNPEIQLIDTALFTVIDGYKEIVNEQYLAPYGISYDELLVENDTLLTAQASEANSLPLGGVVAQALLESVAAQSSVMPQIALVPNGNLSGSLGEGQLTVSDAFGVYAGSSGTDGTVGEALVAFYLSGSDVRNLLEINATLYAKEPSQQLSVAGVSYLYHPYRIPFDRVTTCTLTENGQALEDDTLYLVVAPISIQTQLTALDDKSLISAIPRDVAGAKISSLEETILSTKRGAEFKLWYALALYLQSVDSLTEFAAYRGTAEQDTSLSISALLGSPGRMTIIVLAVAALALLLLFIVIILVATRKRRRRGGSRYGGASRRYRGGRH